MNDWLPNAFALVCGQHPEHVWMPGGLSLPCCQRCTGLYVGAFAAFLLHRLWPPQPTAGWKWMHGLFLVQMVPFGFHWLPQGPVLRTETGVLFGFGLVAFMWLTLGEAPSASPQAARRSGAGLLATLVFVPVLALWGGRFAFHLLSCLAILGAVTLAGLALMNVFLLGRAVARSAVARVSA